MLSRRSLLMGVIGGTPFFFKERYAYALTGIAALDTPAIAVKIPADVLLVAITEAPGGRLVAVGEHGVIIYSDNNGTTWTQAYVPVNVTLNCIAFATDKIGWAAGHFGVILGTLDGGQSWRQQLDGIQANQLIMAAATAPSVAASPSPAVPLAVRRAQRFVEGGPDNPFLTMLVLGPEKLLVFGAYRLAMLTVDGGKSWQDWSLNIYDKYSHNIYDAVKIGNVYYLVLEEGLMYSSSDGANSFQPITSPGQTTLFGVLGAKDDSLIVFGVAGFVARSMDQGKSWTTLNIPTQQDIPGGQILADGTVVLVDEGGDVFTSTDCGVTYILVRGVPQVPFFDVQQAANGNLIAVGATGVTLIAKSLLAS